MVRSRQGNESLSTMPLFGDTAGGEAAMEWLDQQRRMEDDPAYLPGEPPIPDDAAVRTGNPYDPFALAHAKTMAGTTLAAGASSGGMAGGGGVPAMGQLGSAGVNTVGVGLDKVGTLALRCDPFPASP